MSNVKLLRMPHRNYEPAPSREDRQITIALTVLYSAFAVAFVGAFLWLGDYIAAAIDHMGRMPQ